MHADLVPVLRYRTLVHLQHHRAGRIVSDDGSYHRSVAGNAVYYHCAMPGLDRPGWLAVYCVPLFGGDISSALPLLKLTLKLSVVSLASITVFSGMDPEKISDGLLALGMPAAFSFSLSYGYRILPYCSKNSAM